MIHTHQHDPDCIFCKIAKKEIPPLGKGLFWEDADHMARLSPFPNTKGYSILISKTHYESDILKIPQQARNKLMDAATTVGKILENHFDDVGRIGVMMEGTGVNHAHIKLSPMHGTGYLHDHREPYKSDENIEKRYFEKYPGFIVSYDAERADDDVLQKLAKQLKETRR